MAPCPLHRDFVPGQSPVLFLFLRVVDLNLFFCKICVAGFDLSIRLAPQNISPPFVSSCHMREYKSLNLFNLVAWTRGWASVAMGVWMHAWWVNCNFTTSGTKWPRCSTVLLLNVVILCESVLIGIPGSRFKIQGSSWVHPLLDRMIFSNAVPCWYLGYMEVRTLKQMLPRDGLRLSHLMAVRSAPSFLSWDRVKCPHCLCLYPDQ